MNPRTDGFADVDPGVESGVRYYPTVFPRLFERAEGAHVYTADGERYLDFYCGSGSLNYGHNPRGAKEALLAYIERDGVVNVMDLDTVARRQFMADFERYILRPRGLEYRIQCPGPAGTNAVEAAIMLARKAKRRHGIFAFHGAYHGMSLGSLAATGDLRLRGAAGILPNVTFFPYANYAAGVDSLAYMEAVLDDPKSGVSLPAAMLVESVQAEGGVHVAPTEWLVRLRAICDRYDILLIVDDVQMGCGRTGPFFSFERHNIVPDIVTLSKSLSGAGLPLSLVLMKKALDVWEPGEYKGTFRGFQLAFVTARAALEYWKDDEFIGGIELRGRAMERSLADIIQQDERFAMRGVGMIWGLQIRGPRGGELTAEIVHRCYRRGLLTETAGRQSSVLKLMPALTIGMDELDQGLQVLASVVREI